MFTSIRRSVRYKIMAVILATTLAALLVSMIALVTYEARSYRQFLVSDARTQADILARTSLPALQFNDPDSAAANLSLLDNRTNVIAAAIYTAKGSIFAKYIRRGYDVKLPPVHAPATAISGNQLQLFQPIVDNDRLIGTVYLLATYDLAGRLQGYLVILGVVMMLSLGVAFVISLQLQHSVSGPVLAVSAAARKVIENRDFTLRAEKTTDDEIGVLVDSFNSMLSEVGQTTEALEATNRRLQKETDERRAAEGALRLADKRKDEFLATLAHELRNPLAPMVNALSMLSAKDSSGPDTEQRAHGIIGRQLTHLVRLVDDLLDVSRITRGKLAVNAQTIELASVVTNAIDTARPIIEARKHELNVELPKEMVYLHADPVRLSQILSNLLNNSAKYTDPGGRIDLTAEVQGKQLRITVSDNGMGIAPETMPTIFQMFTQGDSSLERRQGGLGVGLALTKRLVELHGGAIQVHSAGSGLGTSFAVSLPTVEAPRLVEEQEVQPAAEPKQALRILLVDDNVDFASSLALLLKEMGHQVSVAHEAQGGLEAARALRPEVAFLDIGLPGINGYELARQLRELAAAADTVLIALSGWGQQQDRMRSHQAGFARHMVKPVELKQILAVLDSLATEA